MNKKLVVYSLLIIGLISLSMGLFAGAPDQQIIEGGDDTYPIEGNWDTTLGIIKIEREIGMFPTLRFQGFYETANGYNCISFRMNRDNENLFSFIILPYIQRYDQKDWQNIEGNITLMGDYFQGEYYVGNDTNAIVFSGDRID